MLQVQVIVSEVALCRLYRLRLSSSVIGAADVVETGCEVLLLRVVVAVLRPRGQRVLFDCFSREGIWLDSSQSQVFIVIYVVHGQML